MSVEREVALGRLAIARGWVSAAVVREVYAALAPGSSLAAALVARGALRPDQAQELERELAAREREATVHLAGAGASVRVGEQHGAGLDAPTVGLPPTPTGPGASAPTLLADGASPGAVGGGGPGAALPAVGATIAGRYRIEALLGAGGMGAVFRAFHLARGEPVALKVLHAAASTPEGGQALARFRREAEAVAQVDAHPGIVRVRDFGAAGALPYCVMDLVEGRDLAARIKAEGPLPLDEALALSERVARAVAHCHARGVLHRDLKPANVLVRASDGVPLVADFGLALAADAERLTRSGSVLGTPAYMPPEQADGRKDELDERCDVYALGATLYALVTGRAPFEGDQVAVLKQVFLDAPAPVTSRRPDAPPGLDAICQVAMAKAKERRYPSAEAFAEDVARLRRGEPIAARPPGWWEAYRWRLRRRDRRAVAQLGAVLVTLILAVGGGVAAWWTRDTLAVEVARAPAILDACGPLLQRADERAAVEAYLRECAAALEGGQESPSVKSGLDALAAALAAAAEDGPATGAAKTLREAGPEARLALERLLRRVALAHGLELKLPSRPRHAAASGAALEAAAREARLIGALRALGWRLVKSAALGPVSPEEREAARDALRVFAAEAAPGDRLGAAAEEAARAVDEAERVALDYLESERAWLEPRVARALAQGKLPPAEAWAADGWRDDATLTKLEPPVGPLAATALAAHKQHQIDQTVDELGAALVRAGSGASVGVCSELLASWVRNRLLPFVAAPPPLPPEDGCARVPLLLEGLIDQLGYEDDRAGLDAFRRLEPVLPEWMVPDRLRAKVFEVLLFASRSLAMRAVEGGASEGEALARCALFYRTKQALGRKLQEALLPYLRDGRLERFARRARSGDAFLLWLDTAGTRRGRADADDDAAGDVARWRLFVALAAAALGPALPPEERAALDLASLDFAALGLEGIALERPLAPYWEPYVRWRLVHHLLKLEKDRSPPRPAVLEAVASELERLRAQGADAFVSWSDRLKFLERAPDDLRVIAVALQPEQPARAAALLEQSRAWAHEALEASLEVARWVADSEPPPEGPGSIWYQERTNREGVVSAVFDAAKWLVTWLTKRGEGAAALKVLPRTSAALAALGYAPSLEFELLQTKRAFELEAYAEAERAARAVEAETSAGASDPHQAARNEEALDEARAWLAWALIRQGRRDEARAVLATAEAAGLVDYKGWRMVRQELERP